MTQQYPTIKEALNGGPGGVQSSINAALTLVTAESISDLIESDLNNWMTSLGIPTYLKMAFRVKRLTRKFDQGSHKFYVSQLNDVLKSTYGNWLEIIYTQIPCYFNSEHLAKYLTFAIYEELDEQLGDKHRAFKITSLYFDDVEKQTEVLKKHMSGYDNAECIQEVLLDYYMVQEAARSMIAGNKPDITPYSFEYRDAGAIILS